MDAETIQELFAAFGPVRVRRLFGGAGLYADGVMFGLVIDDQVYLKTDETSAARFRDEGCAPFEYGTKSGRRVVMSYWSIPSRLYDDEAALAEWARQALAIARQKAATGARRQSSQKNQRARRR